MARSWQANPRQTYGWHGGIGIDVPPYAAPENVMDTFLSDVDVLDHAWLPHAAAAASSVKVTLAGRPVKLDGAGSFRLPRSACGRELVATDGAGGRTALRIGGTTRCATQNVDHHTSRGVTIDVLPIRRKF
jgi:hypothetical protein